MSEWQDISTAPKDGTDILVCNTEDGRPVSIASAVDHNGQWFYKGAVEAIDFTPEFWISARVDCNPYHAPLPPGPRL